MEIKIKKILTLLTVTLWLQQFLFIIDIEIQFQLPSYMYNESVKGGGRIYFVYLIGNLLIIFIEHLLTKHSASRLTDHTPM